MHKKHIIRNILLGIGGFILLLVILAEIFKNDIVKLAIQKGAKTFDVPLNVGEVDFSLIYRFPLATIEFNDLVMTSELSNSDSIVIAPDTLARISKLYASVDLWELMDGNIHVKKIDIEDANFKYLVDSLGKSNFDFLLEGDTDTISEVETDTTIIQGVYSLEKLTLSDIKIDYNDDFMKFKTSLVVPEITVNGELTSSGYMADTDGEIFVKSIDYDNFHLEDLQKSRLLFDISAMNDTLQVKDLTLDAAGAIFNGKGFIVQGDSIYEDLTISGTDIDLAKSFKFLPVKLKKELCVNELEGILNVSGTSQGYISPNTLPQLDFNIDLGDGIVRYDIYPKVKNINLSVNVVNGYASRLESVSVNIKNFQAETDKSKINVSALIQNLTNIQYDVVADIKANLNEIKPYIPDSLINEIGGVVAAKISTSGTLPDSITEEFYDYALERTKLKLNLSSVDVLMDSIPAIKGLIGDFSYTPHNVKLNGLHVNVPDYKVNITDGYLKAAFKGKISSYEDLVLNVDSMMVKMPQSYVSLSGNINGLKRVNYKVDASAGLGLAEIKEMLPDSLVTILEGDILANISSIGSFDIDSVADKAMPLLFENSQFDVSLNQVGLDMPDTTINVQRLTGNIQYCSDTLRLNKIIGSYSGLDFSADSTVVSSIYTAAIQNNKKELFVSGNFDIGDLDYALIEGFMTDTVPMSEQEQKEAMEQALNEEPYKQNYTIKANGKVKVQSFKYGDILAENIGSKFLADISKGTYVSEGLNCNVFGGNVNGSLRYVMTDNPMEVFLRDILEFRLSADSIDVSRMIDELKVYLEDYDITKDNVQGLFSSNMDGRIVLLDYEPALDSIMMSGNIKLENGALIDIDAITDLGSIPRNNIPNLDNMRFYTLTSNLFIYRNNIFIPKTDIFSNSLEASFLGMYSFNGDYDFHIRALLGQILSGKVKKRSKEELESGFDPDDKGKYYKTSYLDGKSKAWFDNKNDRKRMDTRIRMNKRGLTVLFAPNLITYKTGVK